MCFVPWHHNKMYSYDSQSKKMYSYDSYEIVMTYVGNRTIKLTDVMA